eukprot:5733832-Lingulodinium_polyedra.AAC.1
MQKNEDDDDDEDSDEYDAQEAEATKAATWLASRNNDLSTDTLASGRAMVIELVQVLRGSHQQNIRLRACADGPNKLQNHWSCKHDGKRSRPS